MRTGISIKIMRPDRHRLEAITKDRNASQKHVWRASIVLLSADGVGTNEIMRQTGTSKTCVWRWQLVGTGKRFFTGSTREFHPQRATWSSLR